MSAVPFHLRLTCYPAMLSGRAAPPTPLPLTPTYMEQKTEGCLCLAQHGRQNIIKRNIAKSGVGEQLVLPVTYQTLLLLDFSLQVGA